MDKALRIASQFEEIRFEAVKDIKEYLMCIDVTRINEFINDFEKSPHGKGSRGFKEHLEHILKQLPKFTRESARLQMFAKYAVIVIDHTFTLPAGQLEKLWYIGFDQIDDILKFIKQYHHAKESTPADTAQSN